MFKYELKLEFGQQKIGKQKQLSNKQKKEKAVQID